MIVNVKFLHEFEVARVQLSLLLNFVLNLLKNETRHSPGWRYWSTGRCTDHRHVTDEDYSRLSRTQQFIWNIELKLPTLFLGQGLKILKSSILFSSNQNLGRHLIFFWISPSRKCPYTDEVIQDMAGVCHSVCARVQRWSERYVYW